MEEYIAFDSHKHYIWVEQEKLVAAGFSLLRLPEVIVSLVATRVLLQYLPQAVGFFVLRFKQPQMERPFKMLLYPIPGIISLAGWLYILATSARGALLFALVIFALGTAAYLARARKRGEWPFVIAGRTEAK